ncbi:jmjC domain-containing protein 8 isoform X1 [Trichechus manatus latirostris]|uniref:JmjC domain-containing protein 8 isoform X1 n=1 Tax=Trichechus manatus latirostris TaxID=127582 RepID=A0A2Y9QRU3_TRIMA|nr:jmjC domain-containing protein 8 isoform X1 [Trichechus manatus latirostris]
MALGVQLLLLQALWTPAALGRPGSGQAGDGGWQRGGPGAPAAVAEEERCTVERRADLTYAEFVQRYAFFRPVILQGLTDNTRFRALCSRERLLALFGDSVVRLSTANTFSYQKVDLPFQEYVEQLLHPQDPTSLGNGEPRLSGGDGGGTWVSGFQSPLVLCWQTRCTSSATTTSLNGRRSSATTHHPHLACWAPPLLTALESQVGVPTGSRDLCVYVGGDKMVTSCSDPTGAGSGVPFHWHGPGFSEVIYGRKRWFLYPPEKTPEFHPNKTTLAWFHDTYPTLAPSARPLECTIQAGEVLYFPDRWWHATLNLDTSVFISTFLG